MIPPTPRCDPLSQTQTTLLFLAGPSVHGQWVCNGSLEPVESIGAQLFHPPGIIWATVVPGLNQFFFFRYPSVTINNNVAQLLSFPMGRLWARFVPNWKIFGVSINPGPFTIKEHVLVTIMATVGYQSAYAVRL